MNSTHEKSDLDPKYVLYFGIALTVLVAIVYVLMWWLFNVFEREQASRETTPVVVNPPAPIPEPRLQISFEGDLQELRRQENEILTTYRWVDRDKGVARIPVERAMQVFLERQKQ